MEAKKQVEDEDLDFEFDELEDKKYITFQTTRMIESKVPMDREKYLKMSLVELIIHVAFLITIVYIADNSSYKLVYDITNSVTQLFVYTSIDPTRKTIMFYNISNLEEVWAYLSNGFLNGLYWELEFGGRNLTDEEIGYILYRNKLIYFAVMRQIRVKGEECRFETSDLCYNRYNPSDVSVQHLRGTYGVTYNSSDFLGYGKYTGRLTTYLQDGYQVTLPGTKREATSMMHSLKENDWLDRSTRALFLEFILFNKQLNNHCFVVLAFEFPTTGGVFTSYNLAVVKISRFHLNVEIVDVIVDFLFNCFILFYCFIVMIEMAYFKLAYFTYFTSISDLLVVTISLASTAVSLYTTFMTRKIKADSLSSQSALSLGRLLHWSDSAMSVVFCLSFIKLFRYLNFNSTLWSLSKTVYLCSGELSGLLLLCGVVYFAFAVSGLVLFGYDFEEFAYVSNAVASLIRILLGDMDFHPFRHSFYYLGCVFSIIFEAVIFFIFMAGFLAIILSSYSDVSVLHQKQKFEMQMLEYTYRKLAQLFRKKYNEPPLISVQDWIKTMMDLGHPSDAAEIIVSRYASQGITLESFLTYPQQDELTYELEYYLKSSYMKEKLTSLLVGYERARNVFRLKTNPFVTPEMPVRGPTVLSRMLHDINKAENLPADEKEEVYENIKRELKTSRNLLEISKK